MKRSLGILAGLILILGLTTTSWALPYEGADIMLNGNDFSAISDIGTTPQSGGHEWYEEGDTIYTNWANEWVKYSAYLTKGEWNIGLNVQNRGNLGDSGWYTEFEIFNNANNQKIEIPASDEEIFAGYVTQMIDNEGDYTVRYKWLNDKYAPNQGLDANIQVVSAFFDDTSTAPVPEPGTIVLLGLGLAGLGAMGRRKIRK
jgi:hypothetical protein